MKSDPPPRELDVRPLLAQNRPPLPAIMAALAELKEGQALRIIAPFDPAPLRNLLGTRGFASNTTESAPGVWEVEFTRTDR